MMIRFYVERKRKKRRMMMKSDKRDMIQK